MPKVYIINGTGGSGKDTFVKFVKQYSDLEVLNFSSVDFIKWIADKHLGINVKEKSQKLRLFLSEFKRILTEYNDMPYQQCIDAIETLGEEQILFLHVREADEIKKIKKVYPDTLVMCVKRDGADNKIGNKSDDEVDNISYDLIIHNDGDLGELSKSAKFFVQRYVL